MIDLQKFCAGKHELREYLKKPWRCEFGVGATNGHVLVIVPDQDGQFETIYTGIVDAVRNINDAVSTHSIEWYRLSDIKLPEPVACRRCNGKGYHYERECDECDGNGTFEHGSHTYDCLHCDGHGFFKSNRGSESEKKPCPSCDGTGEDAQTVEMFDKHFSTRYLKKLLLELPNCQLGIVRGYGFGVLTFDGGFGAIMPCVA